MAVRDGMHLPYRPFAPMFLQYWRGRVVATAINFYCARIFVERHLSSLSSTTVSNSFPVFDREQKKNWRWLADVFSGSRSAVLVCKAKPRN